MLHQGDWDEIGCLYPATPHVMMMMPITTTLMMMMMMFLLVSRAS
jgi:hypothetical protein